MFFRPGAPPNVRNWWFGLFAALFLPLGAILAWVLSRRPDAVIDDSPQFTDALNLWHGPIALNHKTPRELKRFLNSLRYVAMRWRNTTSLPTPLESLINRAAVLLKRSSYSAPPQPTFDKEAAIACMGALAPFGNGQRVDCAAAARHHESVAKCLDAHRMKFGALPTKDDWDRFYEVLGEVRVR